MSNTHTGTVKWFNEDKGYGFIAVSGSKDIFVHARSVNSRSVPTLEEGQKVSFNITNGMKGEQASDVTLV